MVQNSRTSWYGKYPHYLRRVLAPSQLVVWDFPEPSIVCESSGGGVLWYPQSGVSKNRGTPKWMVCNGKPCLNGWFGGKPTIFGNTQFNNFLGISAQGNEAEATPLVRQVSVDASDGPSDLVLPEDNEQEMPEKQAPVETPKKKAKWVKRWKGLMVDVACWFEKIGI